MSEESPKCAEPTLYEFPEAYEKFIKEDGSCELSIDKDALPARFVESWLEGRTEISTRESLQKFTVMLHFLKKAMEETKRKALLEIEEEYRTKIKELQYFVDKQEAILLLEERYTVTIEVKNER